MKDFIVVDSATMQCKYGCIESTFLNSEDNGFVIEDKNAILDSNIGIGDFLFCSLHKRACKFKTLEQRWKNPANCGTDEGKYITAKSVLFCAEGGRISVTNAGQDCVMEEDGMLKFIDPE